MANLERDREVPLKEREGLRSKLRLGLLVFVALMVIEIVEFVVGVSMKQGAWRFLAPWAVIGAWPIVRFYMHIDQLKHPEE